MTVVNPPWSFNLNFAKGDIPSGYYPALYDHTGTLIPNQQFDQARTWSDGSLRRATFSMISPDTFAGNGNSGDTFNYSVHKTAGSPSRTPLVTLADVQAQDIKLVFSGFDCGSDQFQLQLNDLLAAANNVIRSSSQPYASYVGTLATNAATPSGNTLSFAALTATVTDTAGGSLPFQVGVGMQASGTNIPAGTHVTAISGMTVTLSAAVTGSGVASGATISFDHPVWQYDQIKYGPVCSEWKFRGLLRRVSDGAWHRWVYAVIFLKAWGKTGPWEFTVRAEQSNCYGPHPTGSVGTVLASNGSSTLPNASPMPRFAATATLYNSDTVLAHFGGLNDWTAFTLDAATFPVAGGCINVPTYPVDSTGDRSFRGTGWAFDAGTGTLPTGLESNKVYWPAAIPWMSKIVLCTQKFHSVGIEGGGTPPAWAANTAVGAGYYYQTSDGTVWMPTSNATTGTTPPAPNGTGADVTTPDGITWEQATQVISGGSGTISMFQVPALFANTAWLGKDRYGNAIWWQGSGSLAARPKLMLGPEFNYLTTRTTAVPPFNPSIATSPNNPGATVPLPDGLTFDYDRGSGINYYHSYQPNNAPPWNPSWNMSEYGDDPGDERVGPISFQSSWLLYRPDSPILHQLVRCLGYSQADWPIWFINEQSGYLWAVNEGPGRVQSVGGSNYAGLGNTDPSASGVQSGYWPTVNQKPPYGLPRYLCAYGPMIDALHLQHLLFVPMLLDGDMADWETSAGLAIATAMSNGQNYPNLYYYPNFHQNFGGCVAELNGNPRGMAWSMRVMGNTEFMMPDGHPLFHFIRDCFDDSAAVFPAFYNDQANLAPNQSLQGQVVGFYPFNTTINGTAYMTGVGFQMAMHQFVWGWMAWREEYEGRRTTFKDYLIGYMAPQINIMNGDYQQYGSEYWAGPHDWVTQFGDGTWFPGGATDAIKNNFPSIYANIPAANFAINDPNNPDTGGVGGNAFGGNSASLNSPPGTYPWDTNNYATMTFAAFAMLSWIGYPGAQNVYNRIKTRVNSAPCQGITWAQTSNAHYDMGHPQAYLAWNVMSAVGN